MNLMVAVAILALLCAGCNSNSKTIRIKGSDTEVNLAVTLAEAFGAKNDSCLIAISGGGSGLGIASLINGTTDIANSSRRIKDEELALFTEKSIVLDSFVFAQDAIAFVVNGNITLDTITAANLAKVLSGETKNWEVLIGKKLPINIYGRQSNSGTHDFIKKILAISYSPYAKQMNGNAQILEGLKKDKSGIGYVSAGYIMAGKNEGIRVLKIARGSTAAVSPLDYEKIAEGAYFFQRPLFQYYKKSEVEKVKPFIDFEKSSQGKNIIAAAGYYPVAK